MAPEVLTNPCTRLEEKTATQDLLDVRNIVPYTTKVDVWAVGVLAYELVMGRPPFEVDNEAATVARILQSDDIDFGAHGGTPWADFVRCAPRKRIFSRNIGEAHGMSAACGLRCASSAVREETYASQAIDV